MRLPYQLLHKVQYYTYNVIKSYEGIDQPVFHEEFILHFKAWWRFRKIIKIRCIRDRVEYDGTKKIIYQSSPDGIELKKCLEHYFGTR